jgi:hypothetical protein
MYTVLATFVNELGHNHDHQIIIIVIIKSTQYSVCRSTVISNPPGRCALMEASSLWKLPPNGQPINVAIL